MIRCQHVTGGVDLEVLVDQNALDRLYEHRIEPGTKGMPPDAVGGTVAELVRQRRPLFTGGFSAPVLVLHRDALEHNLALMADFCRTADVELAPHGKTTLAPQLFARQLAHGAYGMTAASGTHLQVYRAFGVRRVIVANPLVDLAVIAWLRGELAADPGFEVLSYVDSVAAVDLLASQFNPARTDRPFPVLVEVGFPAGRTGCRSMEQAVDVANAVASAPGLRLGGVAAFEGIVAAPDAPDARERVTEFLVGVRRVAQRLYGAGLVDGQFLLSAGGSAYFDRVVDVFAGGWPDDRPVRIVLRSGSYAVHETGPHAGLTPFARAPHAGHALRPALELWGQVLCRPEPDRALLGFGRRGTSFDVALPDPVEVRHADEAAARPLTGAHTTAVDDEHAYLRVPPDQRLGIGDWVGFGQAHPCTAFDKWRLVAVVEDDHVVDLVRTFF